MRSKTMKSRTGYTLLEILIATTILVIGLIAVFGISTTAQRKSVSASDLADVQLVCETTLNELLAGQDRIKPFSLQNIDGVRHWKLTLSIYPSPYQELSVLHLAAQKFSSEGNILTGTPYHLLRWVPKDRVELPKSLNLLDTTSEFEDPFDNTGKF